MSPQQERGRMTDSGPLEDTPWVTHPVMCAFCGDSVETAHPDPCALIVVTNWRGPDEGQQEQQFFAHAACMLTSLHPEVAAEAVVLHQGIELGS
jgi:hypothetical protein